MASTLDTAAELIVETLLPLAYSLEAADKDVMSFMRRLGWELPSVPAGLRDLQTPSAALVEHLGQLRVARLGVEEGTGSDDEVTQALALVAGDLIMLAAAIGTLPGNLQAQLPQAYLDATGIADHIEQRLLDWMVTSALRRRFPTAYQILFTLGVVEETREDADAVHFQPPFVLYEVRWERIPRIFTNPGNLVHDVYGWGTPALDTPRLFEAIRRLSTILLGPAVFDYPDDNLVQALAPGAVISVDDGPPPLLMMPLLNLDLVTLSLVVFPLPTASTTEPQPLGLTLTVTGDLTLPIPLSDTLTLTGKAEIDLSTGAAVVLRPGQPPIFKSGLDSANPIAVSGKVNIRLTYTGEDGQRAQILSTPGGIVLDAKELFFGFGAEGHTTGGVDSSIEGGVTGGRLMIKADQTDGFLAKILPKDGVQVDFEFGIGWSKARGVYFQGSAGLEAEIGLHTSIGPFQLDSLHLSIAAAAAGLKLETSVTGKGVLGPVTASVERIGLNTNLDFHTGNLGPVQGGLDFKPPSGLGIVVDAGVVTGGGFITFDPPNGRYSGGIELKIEEIVVKAYGLLDTKLPDGTPGFSFLIIITAEFTPIQLGFGFTLEGVGGLAGINRTMVLDVLQAGFRSHSIDSILFPDIHNAQKIISDLRAIFPPAEGRYVFGPMVEIGWGTPTLVAAQIGVILEVPAPIRLAILGLIVAALPEDDGDDTVVLIHLEVLGTLDFGLKKMAIDASIYDSRIVAFSLFGDMAMRLSWGTEPMFAFSLGGLHPQFQPPPAFPHLRRLTLSIGSGDNPRMSLMTYMAVTANTVQFGADLELYAAYGGFKVHGFLAFDALFVLSPFSLTTEMRAGVDVQYDGVSLCGISLDFILTGPTPWTYKGTATLHFLFFDVSAGVSGSFGGGTAKELPAEPVLDPLLKALNDARSWSAVLPEGATRGVSFLAPKPDDTTIYVHPTGQLTVRQSVVPLSTPITKFGSARPSDGDEFDITGATLTVAGSETTVTATPVTDSFARAQYEDMSDGDKLAAKSYEPFPSGVTLGDPAVEAGSVSTLDLHYDTQIIDDVFMPARPGPRYRLGLELQVALSRQGAGELSPLRVMGNARYMQPGMTSPIATSTPGFVITSVDDLSIRYDITGGQATTQRAAGVLLEAHVANNPQDAGRLQIMPIHEVAA